MKLGFVSRRALICTVIFAMLVTNVSVATPTKTVNHSHTHSEGEALVELSTLTLVMIGVTSLGQWLTPLDEWRAEIHKLTEDELFVERWMLLNDDPASVEKANKAIANIQKQRKALEKKYNRFQWLYYPAISVIGMGAMMLTLWLQRN